MNIREELAVVEQRITDTCEWLATLHEMENSIGGYSWEISDYEETLSSLETEKRRLEPVVDLKSYPGDYMADGSPSDCNGWFH